MEKTLLKTMLFDFYGDLLTEKQREYYDLYYNEDLSLSEIAENVGITRQGVHDIVARAETCLLETERKTGLIRRFGELQAGLSRAVELAEQLQSGAATETDAAAAAQLIEILNRMKV